jgi:hypothetical protein
MIVKGQASSTPNWSAVGRILKSYTYSVMTDAMGDLPYSQALKGDTNLAPAYDTQQQIYTGMLADLAQANTEISPAGIGFTSGDLMYGGDMTKWRKFANSLRLRLAIHLSIKDPAKGATEAAAAVTAGLFASNADNATLMYLASPPNGNPIYNDRHIGGRDDYGLSKTYVDSLTSWADPRLPVFAQVNPANTGYQGLPNGLNDGEGTPIVNISRIGAFWRESSNAPMDLLTYSEVLFLEAEAAERGWIPGGSAAASAFYTNAIKASMKQYGIDTATTATYLAQGKVGYDSTALGATLAGHLQQIAYQKWVSLFMQGMESWTEVRRTRIPLLVPGPRAVFGAGVAGRIPERLPYDDNESVLNKANLDAAVASQGFSAGNDIQKALWFTGR